ncbi:MAG TPA: tetratricopeptide repeat protein [bacterium]|nr:tetratricopeptide repeat protein [bacterium]
MGGVYSASGSDALSPLYNPAGLASLDRSELSVLTYKPYMGLEGVNWNYYLLSYARPFGRLKLGLIYSAYDADSVYGENTVQLSAGLKGRKTDLGFSLKSMGHSYTFSQDFQALYSENSKEAFSLDAGLRMKLGARLSWGLALFNILPADLGLKEEDIVPLSLRTGIGFHVPSFLNMQNLNLGLEIIQRNQSWGEGTGYALGAEGWILNNRMAIRTGLNDRAINVGTTALFNFAGQTLDLGYAFSLPMTGLEGAMSHRLQLSCRFGREVSEGEPGDGEMSLPEKRKKDKKISIEEERGEEESGIEIEEEEMPEPKKEKPLKKEKKSKKKSSSVIEEESGEEMYGEEHGEEGEPAPAEIKTEKEENVEIEEEMTEPKKDKKKKRTESEELSVEDAGGSGATEEKGVSKKESQLQDYKEKAESAYEGGKYSKAIKVWKKALKLDPENGEIRAKIEEAEKKYDEESIFDE